MRPYNTYFRIQFTNFDLNYTYTIVESMSDVYEYLKQEEVINVLCNSPELEAEIKITGIQMTKEEFSDWHKKHVKP